jgi:hypothetical protein
VTPAKRIVCSVIFALVCAGLASTANTATEPVIAIGDVARFNQLYDATNGHPTAEQIQHEYLDPGSEGCTTAQLRPVSNLISPYRPIT